MWSRLPKIHQITTMILYHIVHQYRILKYHRYLFSDLHSSSKPFQVIGSFLRPMKTSVDLTFCEKSQRLKVVNYFCKTLHVFMGYRKETFTWKGLRVWSVFSPDTLFFRYLLTARSLRTIFSFALSITISHLVGLTL